MGNGVDGIVTTCHDVNSIATNTYFDHDIMTTKVGTMLPLPIWQLQTPPDRPLDAISIPSLARRALATGDVSRRVSSNPATDVAGSPDPPARGWETASYRTNHSTTFSASTFSPACFRRSVAPAAS